MTVCPFRQNVISTNSHRTNSSTSLFGTRSASSFLSKRNKKYLETSTQSSNFFFLLAVVSSKPLQINNSRGFLHFSPSLLIYSFFTFSFCLLFLDTLWGEGWFSPNGKKTRRDNLKQKSMNRRIV